jgi:hypothetical protein
VGRDGGRLVANLILNITGICADAGEAGISQPTGGRNSMQTPGKQLKRREERSLSKKVHWQKLQNVAASLHHWAAARS